MQRKSTTACSKCGLTVPKPVQGCLDRYTDSTYHSLEHTWKRPFQHQTPSSFPSNNQTFSRRSRDREGATFAVVILNDALAAKRSEAAPHRTTATVPARDSERTPELSDSPQLHSTTYPKMPGST